MNILKLMSNIFRSSKGNGAVETPGVGSNGSIAQSDLSRNLPRQVSTGTYRGTQTITGELRVADSVTNSTVISISGPNQQQLFTDPRTQINYMVAGKFSDTEYGVKIAKRGVDVLKATDDQLIFNSNQNIFKIVRTLNMSLSVTTQVGDFGSGSTVVPHNLPYIPAMLAFITVDPQLQLLSSAIGATNRHANPAMIYLTSNPGDIITYAIFEVTVDQTNVNFSGALSAVSAGSTFANSATVYLLQESFTGS